MTREEKINILKAIIQECEEYQWQRKETLFEIIKDLEQESTTKNYSEVSSELDKNSKKLEKDFGELDCISRAQTQTKIEMNASRYTIAKERGGMGQVEWSDQLIKVSDAVDIIRHLLPVTPIRPKGHWVHGKELSKEYRGRILVDVTYADWHCSNCNYVIKGTVKPKWNYCPNCGAKMVEPQESEDKG